jgi:uncharacterized membrane-anchored protein YhcB (DUF1043 family)
VLIEVVNSLAGLVIGLVTGYYFERRATKAAKAENGVLQTEIDKLRLDLVGGRALVSTPVSVPASLLDQVMHDARRHQGGNGRLRIAELRSLLIDRGHSSALIDAAITELERSGSLVRLGSEMRVAR